MSKTKLPVSKEEWFFENYKQDAVFEFGPFEVEEEEVLKFARRYDPQPFHIDPEAKKKSLQRTDREWLADLCLCNAGVGRALLLTYFQSGLSGD